MEEKIISFETAKIAKERGFNSFTTFQYIQYDDNDWRLKSNQEFRELSESIGIGDKIRIAAPTQSLLQKWLRVKYSLYIKVHPVYRDKKVMWEYVIFFLDEPLLSGTDGFKNKMSLLNHPYYWETYEEALEEGLKTALKSVK